MDEHFTKDHKISQAVTIAAGAAGATDIAGAILDMQGFSKLAVIVAFGAIVTGAATSIKLSESDDSAMGDPEDIEGSSQTVADDKDNKVFVIDVIRTTKRYVQLTVARATQAATVHALYVQSGADTKPVTQPAEVVGVELFRDAVGGTA